jgi:N-acetylmuramoyl-L-alanine amidase
LKLAPIFLSVVALASLVTPTLRAQDSTTKPSSPRVAPVVHSTPKPYVNSFPVTHTPVAIHGVPASTTTPVHHTASPQTTTPAPTPTPSSLKVWAHTPSPATTKTAEHPAAQPAAPAPKPTPTVSKTPPTPAPPTGPTYGPFNRATIVLDPAHGSNDSGSRLSDSLVEKDVTLAFAFKLRSLLQARGFTVVLTRDSDAATGANNPATQLTLDDRAGIANHARPVACILLHATGAGTGVHLYHSELDPTPSEATNPPWLTAQAPWVNQSNTLSQKLAQSLTRAEVPLVASAASVRPVDSLTCPALVIELAPSDVGDPSSITDSDYQQKIAQALAGALVFWRNQAQPPQRLAVPELTSVVTP